MELLVDFGVRLLRSGAWSGTAGWNTGTALDGGHVLVKNTHRIHTQPAFKKKTYFIESQKVFTKGENG